VILSIGFNDPFLIGLVALAMLLGLIFIRVGVVFAAAVVGVPGLVELLGRRPARSARSRIPYPRPTR
jgi:hypothetical protein